MTPPFFSIGSGVGSDGPYLAATGRVSLEGVSLVYPLGSPAQQDMLKEGWVKCKVKEE